MTTKRIGCYDQMYDQGAKLLVNERAMDGVTVTSTACPPTRACTSVQYFATLGFRVADAGGCSASSFMLITLRERWSKESMPPHSKPTSSPVKALLTTPSLAFMASQSSSPERSPSPNPRTATIRILSEHQGYIQNDKGEGMFELCAKK